MSFTRLRPNVKTPQNEQNTNLAGWAPQHYHPEAIDDIAEPDSGKFGSTIVSLPTPFANLELQKRAFESVAKNIGSSIGYFPQLVSQCLDIWEGLFNWEQNKEGVAFRPWSFQRVKDLEASGYEGQRVLGRTLRLFIQHDHSAYKALKGLTIITYKNTPMAATSPQTGFFFNYHGDDPILWKSAEGHDLFRHEVRHLHSRNDKFQRFMYLLMVAGNGRGTNKHFLTALFKYMHESLKHSPIKGQIQNEEANGYNWETFLQEYPEKLQDDQRTVLQVIDSDDSSFELTFPVKADANQIDPDTSFRIAATRKPDGELPPQPLVLSDKGLNTMRYHLRNWDNARDKVKTYDGDFTVNHAERRLPTVNLKWPYLTVGDLLDEFLLDVGYPIYHIYFLTSTEPDCRQFLLPLKPLFFQYFRPEDVVVAKAPQAGKPTVVIRRSVSTVTVELHIPLAGKGHLCLSRGYSTEISKTRAEVQEGDGIGSVVKFMGGMAIFPFIITDRPEYNDYYKVVLVDSERRGANLKFSFLDKDGNALAEHATLTEGLLGKGKAGAVRCHTRVTANKGTGMPGCLTYEVRNTYPAAIYAIAETDTDRQAGVILPNWQAAKVTVGDRAIKFAVDFGTTNSHIAYTFADQNTPQPLTYTPDDHFIVRLDAPETSGATIEERYDPRVSRLSTQRNTMVDYQRRLLMPSILNKPESAFGFPTRTIVSEKRDFREADTASLFGTHSFRFNYQLWNAHINDDDITNLKWSEDPRNAGRIEALLTQWCLLIRTKALMLGCNPGRTELIRFIPNAMPMWQRNRFRDKWYKALAAVMHTDESQIVELSESEGPFHKYNLDLKLNSTTVIVDIGGGTTDLLLVRQDSKANEIKAVPDSFYFAGNTLYGDFEDFLDPGEYTRRNGLWLALEPAASRNIDQFKDDEHEVKSVFNQFVKTRNVKSEDLIDFLFKVDNASKVISILSGDTLLAQKARVGFLFHFAAICFYARKKAKANGLNTPENLVLSGTGSKYLRFISPSSNDLKDFAAAMLTETPEQAKALKLRIYHHDNPKVITAEGGLHRKYEVEVSKDSSPYFGNDWGFSAGYHPSYDELQRASYLPDDSEYKQFVEQFLTVMQQTKAADQFNLLYNAAELKEDLLAKEIENVEKAVHHRTSQLRNMADLVIEPTFFYPVAGAICDYFRTLTAE